MPSIFLSYARSDDEPFVKRIYQDLTKNKFEVWWDRVNMPSRQLTFNQEIRNAISARDRLLLVVGPQAVKSDYVNQEWVWASEMGKCINPIIRLDELQENGKKIDGYEIIPEGLKLIHSEDFRDDSKYQEHLTNLVRQLSDPTPPLGKLIAVPTLPAHYHAQPEKLQQLRDILLADLQKNIKVSTGAVARVGVHGMVGIGKSILATALARDLEVRRSFPDGIFWIPIGLHPNLVNIQRQTLRILGGDPSFDDINVGKTRLRELFEDCAVLLILDDIWQASDANVFDVVGPRSKLLLTTRDAGLVTTFTGIAYQIQLPTVSEASALLATAARIPTGGVLPPITEKIIDECGRLPLALALCGSMALKGQTWERILQMLREKRLELITDRQEINETHRSIWSAIEVSVSILSPDEQRRFAELAVFSFDFAVPEETVLTLWKHTGKLDDLASADLLMSFYERSLVLIDRPAGSIGISNIRVSLHDLLFDFATRSAIQYVGNIALLHNQLIDAYQEKYPDKWPSGPDDGYFLQHITGHLLEAGQEDRLGEVLANPNYFIAKWKQDEYALKANWIQIEKRSNLKITQVYREVLQNPRGTSNDEYIHHLSEFFDDIDLRTQAISLFEYLIHVYIDDNDKEKLLRVLSSVAWPLYLINKGDIAIHLLKISEYLSKVLNDSDGLQRTYFYQASITSRKTERELFLFRLQRKICEDMDDPWLQAYWLQLSYGNEGLLLKNLSEWTEAMELFKLKQVTCQEMGIKQGLQWSYNYQADFLEMKKRYPEAMELLKKQEEIAAIIGYKRGLRQALISQERIYSKLYEEIKNKDYEINKEKIKKQREEIKKKLHQIGQNSEIRIKEFNYKKFLHHLKTSYLRRVNAKGAHLKSDEHIQNLGLLSLIYELEGKFTKSLTFNKKQEDLCGNNHLNLEVISRLSQVRILAAIGKYYEAFDKYKSVLQYQLSYRDYAEIHLLMMDIGNTLLKSNQNPSNSLKITRLFRWMLHLRNFNRPDIFLGETVKNYPRTKDIFSKAYKTRYLAILRNSGVNTEEIDLEK